MTDPGDVDALSSLVTRFPYMFADERLRERGIDCYRGWLQILNQVCEEINAALGADQRHFRWTHIGEKYGSGCFRYAIDSATSKAIDVGTPEQPLRVLVDHAPTEPVVLAVATIVAKAVEATRTTCCVCGAAAEARPQLRRRIPPTLCELHKANLSLLISARIIEGFHG